MMYFQKKPHKVAAVQWTGYNHDEVLEVVQGYRGKVEFDGGLVRIEMFEGEFAASVYDWIVRGLLGEVLIYKNSEFEKQYELYRNE